MKVFKFGGASIKDAAAVKNVAAILQRHKNEQLVIIVSAMVMVAANSAAALVLATQVQAQGVAGDVFIGISTSGNSPNIVNAFASARSKGVITVGFTGTSGGKMKACSDYLINIPSTDTPRIQESHILVGHIICQLAEEKYFG